MISMLHIQSVRRMRMNDESVASISVQDARERADCASIASGWTA